MGLSEAVGICTALRPSSSGRTRHLSTSRCRRRRVREPPPRKWGSSWRSCLASSARTSCCATCCWDASCRTASCCWLGAASRRAGRGRASRARRSTPRRSPRSGASPRFGLASSASAGRPRSWTSSSCPAPTRPSSSGTTRTASTSGCWRSRGSTASGARGTSAPPPSSRRPPPSSTSSRTGSRCVVRTNRPGRASACRRQLRNRPPLTKPPCPPHR